ncbi:MAG: hypothetical protein ACC642_10235, partial [Pseudomonadales bacterium]
GGGLPKSELMRMFHPDEPEPVMHASTFSGNPLSMAAGYAAMEQLDPQKIAHVNGLGEHFRQGVNDTFAHHAIRGQATGLGSLSNIHFTDAPIRDARDSIGAIMGAGGIGQLLHLAMLRRGITSASRLMYCISTPMTVADIDTAIDTFDDALKWLKPGIERERPQLLM